MQLLGQGEILNGGRKSQRKGEVSKGGANFLKGGEMPRTFTPPGGGGAIFLGIWKIGGGRKSWDTGLNLRRRSFGHEPNEFSIIYNDIDVI